MNLTNLKWTKLSEFVLSGMKALHVMLNFFFGGGGGGGAEFHTWVWFSLEGKTI